LLVVIAGNQSDCFATANYATAVAVDSLSRVIVF
jgi:hypothetical protein